MLQLEIEPSDTEPVGPQLRASHLPRQSQQGGRRDEHSQQITGEPADDQRLQGA